MVILSKLKKYVKTLLLKNLLQMNFPIPDCYKTQLMCERVIDDYIILFRLNLFLIAIKIMKCVKKLFLKILIC